MDAHEKLLGLDAGQLFRREIPGFTARYRIDCIVYIEEYGHVNEEIARGQPIKRWSRKKMALIASEHPDWRDLGDAIVGE